MVKKGSTKSTQEFSKYNLSLASYSTQGSSGSLSFTAVPHSEK